MSLELHTANGDSEAVPVLPPGEVLRFALGSPEAHGLTWRVWSHKSELYVSARYGAQVSKYSLHKSGDWRLAYGREYADAHDMTDRIVDRWRRPEPDVYGATLGLSIHAVVGELRNHLTAKSAEDVTWIHPDGGEVISVHILLLQGNGSLPLPPDFHPVAALELADGTLVLIVKSPSQLSEEAAEQHELLRAQSGESVAELLDDAADLRTLAHGADGDGNRFVWDLLTVPKASPANDSAR